MRAEAIGKDMSDQQVVNFEQYLGLLLKWNRAYNLTAINDPIEVYDKHFADSAMALQLIPEDVKLVDIGTGAGFPGIPLKILRDDIKVTLIEATEKKVNFCEHVVRELKLKGVKVINGRAESEETRKKAGKFDFVISRATMKLGTYAQVAEPYLKRGGYMIAMVGSSWSDDFDKGMSKIKKAGLKLIKVHEYKLPMSQSERALLVFEKKL